MARTGYPVVMDATHSVATAGRAGGLVGRSARVPPVMAQAGVAVGVAAVFIEDPSRSRQRPSDGPNMIHLDRMPALVAGLMQFDRGQRRIPQRSDDRSPHDRRAQQLGFPRAPDGRRRRLSRI